MSTLWQSYAFQKCINVLSFLVIKMKKSSRYWKLKTFGITFQAHKHTRSTQTHAPWHQLSSYFLSSHTWPWSIDCVGHLAHRSPWQSPMSRFVTILRSDHCCPMGSALEADMQLGVFQDLWLHATSLSSPFSLHTHKTFVFPLLSYKLFSYFTLFPHQSPCGLFSPAVCNIQYKK